MAKDNTDKQESGRKSKNILFTVLAAGLIVLLGGGIGAYLYLNGGKELLPFERQQAQLEQQTLQIGPMVNIEPFIVNILDDERSRYLKTAITLELDSPQTSIEVNQRLPQIQDAMLLLLSNKTNAELSDLQGKIQLRAELINKLNGILTNGKVKQIYFTAFVVQ